MKTRLVAAATLVLGLSARANAGSSNEVIDYLQVVPIVGGETTHIGIGGVTMGPTGEPVVRAGEFTFTGFTFGGIAGIRLAPISLGVLFQRTQAQSPNQTPFDVNRLYGEFGINAQ